MINQSINNLNELLEVVTSNSTNYYIEQKSIVTKDELNGHITYSRFKKFKGKVTPILIKQHLQKEINLAVPINNTNSIVYEYRGKHQEAFVALLSYYYKLEGVDRLFITTYESGKLVVYLRLENKNDEYILKLHKKIEKKLEDKLIKEWKVIPNNLRPEIGNLFILPREFIKKD